MTVRILFLCTNNATRSPMAEAIARHLASGFDAARLQVEAFSAAAEPALRVDPRAFTTLQAHGIDAANLRPKSISVFSGESFDYVIGVYDRGREPTPIFPGHDALYWGYADPASEQAERVQEAFKSLALGLLLRVRLLLEFHVQSLDRPRDARELNARLMRFAMAQTRGSVERLLSVRSGFKE